MITSIFHLIGFCLIVATLLPLSRSKYWMIRAFDFPRAQILVLIVLWLVAVLIAAVFAVPTSLFMIIPVLICGVYQAHWIYPFSPIVRKELKNSSSSQPTSLSILSSNVLMDNRNSEALIRLVRTYQPDVLLTLETDQWWQSKLDELKEYKYRVQCPKDNLYGIHLYSRLPLTDSHVDYIVDEEIPSIAARVAITDDKTVRLHAMHPTPPVPGENSSSLDRDVELIVLAKSLEFVDEPVIVMGDLNDVAWSTTTRLFRKISGLLDPRIGRGLYATFDARKWYFRWPLDHVFASEHFRVLDLQRLPHIGSDHFPIFIEFELSDEPTHPQRQREFKVDEEALDETLSSETAKKASKPSLD